MLNGDFFNSSCPSVDTRLIQLRLLYAACVDESTIGVSLSGEVACFLRAGGVAAVVGDIFASGLAVLELDLLV